MVPRAVSVTHWDADVSLHAMKRVLSRPETEPFALHPGDPVVVCTHGLSPGGAERQWICLAEALSAAGYAVTFVVCNPLDGETAHYLPDLQRSGIPLVDASTISPTDRMRSCIRNSEAMVALRSKLIPERDRLMNLAATFAALAPKAVFTQLDEPNILAGFAAHIAGVPRVILSFCNVNPTNFDYIYKDWYRAAYRLLSASRRVRFSGNQRDANIDYANWIGMEADRVAHIPNGIARETFPIPTERQLAAARDELKLAADTPVLLGVFRLSAEKDPLAFVEVCARVARTCLPCGLFWSGSGRCSSRSRNGSHGSESGRIFR
jgi:glycosyltransferase involved in cell wall biosynthesis